MTGPAGQGRPEHPEARRARLAGEAFVDLLPTHADLVAASPEAIGIALLVALGDGERIDPRDVVTTAYAQPGADGYPRHDPEALAAGARAVSEGWAWLGASLVIATDVRLGGAFATRAGLELAARARAARAEGMAQGARTAWPRWRLPLIAAATAMAAAAVALLAQRHGAVP